MAESSYNGGDPVGLRYRNKNNNSIEIKVEEDTSLDTEVDHINETVDFLAVEGGGTLSAVPTPQSQVVGEVGTISNLNHNSQTIELDNTYTNPVVFVQPPSYNGISQALVRLDDLTADSFNARIQEPNHLDGLHAMESASYFIFEAGTWELEDGTLLEVGTQQSEGLVSQGFDAVELENQFRETPVVVSQVQTENGGDFVRTRQKNTTVDGFSIAMEEEEANKNSGHNAETLGWLAIEPRQGSWGDGVFYAGQTGNSITDEWSSLEFDSMFTSTPQLMAGISSYNGGDPAGLRYRNLDRDGVQIRVEEDLSADTEVDHISEVVDFLLYEGTGSLSAIAVDTVTEISADTQSGLTTQVDDFSLFGSNEFV